MSFFKAARRTELASNAVRQTTSPRAASSLRCNHSLALRFSNARSPSHVQGSRYSRVLVQARRASTTTTAASAGTRVKNLVLGTLLLLGGSAGYFYATDARASIHSWIVVPLLRLVFSDAEDAHAFGNSALKVLYTWGMHIRERGDPDSAGDLAVKVFGHTLSNPIATSAGIDKAAEIPDPLLALGPSIIEVGGVTPLPQDGNPRPRVFRVPSQNGLINRYGLNSEGAELVAMRLRQRVREFAYHSGLGMGPEGEQAVLDGEMGVPPGSLTRGKLMAVQIAKNKFTPDDDIEAIKNDYVHCVDTLARYADIIVINVSSPNTPGLRGLQKVEPLTKILRGVVEAAQKTDRRTKPAVAVKVSPDEDSDEQILGICDAVWSSGVDAVIVGNTTLKRMEPMPGKKPLTTTETRVMLEQGGYSGPQLFQRTVSLVKRYRHFLDEGLQDPQSPGSEEKPKVIFATGGITNGKQALEVLQAGASVAMVYTALVYGGAGTISRLKSELRDEMRSKIQQSSG